jgi:hypothetical protein
MFMSGHRRNANVANKPLKNVTKHRIFGNDCTVMLSAVLSGCETCLFTLTENRSRLVRRMDQREWQEEMRNEEPQTLCALPDIPAIVA